MNETVRGMMRWVAAFAILMGVLQLVAPVFSRGSNCGGNTAALAAGYHFWLLTQVAADEDPDQWFSPETATPDQLEDLRRIARSTPDGRFLVRRERYQLAPAGPRRIIIVCDRAYRNVPETILGLAPPTHAAGYSDGTTGLIPVAEFRALDRSKLVPLDELLAEARP